MGALKPNTETVRHIARKCLLKRLEEKEAESDPYDS
jgi:hypothetical protein